MFDDNGEDESPESPPPCDYGTAQSFSQTKIRVETDDGMAGLRFSLDRIGYQNYGDGGNTDSGELLGRGIFRQRPHTASSIPRRDTGYDMGAGRGGGGSRGGEGYWSNDDRGTRPTRRPVTATSTSEWGSRRDSYSPASPDRREDRNSSRREVIRPLYNVESEVMLPGISARIASDTRDRSERVTPPAPRPKNCCWNCQGDHMITECPVPKDPRRIAMNRKTFLAAKAQRTDYSGGGGGGGGGTGAGRYKRYHEEQTGRLGSSRPGVISDELQYAMGLDKDEVPLYVYRMRLFGYPPGWMDNAMEEASSGLKLYGDTITMPVGSLKRDSKINPDSIISYPGFNTPMPFGQPDRGREFGCPLYRNEDSIENMLRKLSSRNLVSDGDGIVSQPSQPPQWDSLAGVDRPILNDGASHGIGRGRYIEVDTLPRHLQPGRGIMPSSRPRSPIYRERIDREARPRQRPHRPIVVEDVDERYLPQQPKTIAQKRNRRVSRTPSPSLLQDGGSMDHYSNSDVIPRPVAAGRKSPVIVNLPPVPRSPKNKGKNGDSDADDETGGTTGSSNDFATSPAPKRKKGKGESEVETDDEVTIIPTGKDDTFDYDSDCLVIDDTSPVKSIPKKSSVKKASKTVSKQNKLHNNMDIRDSEDWENDTRVTRPKPLPSPGSSTGDEASFLPTIDDGQGKTLTKPSKPSVRDNFDEDWEAESNCSDTLVIVEDPVDENDPKSTPTASGNSSPTQKRAAEFIPPNPKMDAIKKVFLDHIEETDENEQSFSSLPAFEKFAHGMPEMVFETDAPERIGRLDKVLQVLKTRKTAGNVANDNLKK